MSTDRIIELPFVIFQPVLLVFVYWRVQKKGRISDFYGLFPIDRKKDPEGFRQWLALSFFILWLAYGFGVLAFFFPPPWHVTATQLQAAPSQH